MVDFGKSDKMIKISRKVDKENTYYRFNILFFIENIYIHIYIYNGINK